ncbi:family 16 glycoside hydrolase [Rubritalea marina]|uniref:family 16 glycoside hydrolase n=1 Tax=Rubritalea marina TaxID=361055 RepID=UPI0003670F61|nr:family 16 glycoside hydrolase [Rubritalea marina]
MKNTVKRITGLVGLACISTAALTYAGEPQELFNGKDLSGWTGDKKFWSVQDGIIVGQTTPENPSGGNFLIWDGGEVEDFEITLKVRYEGNNSGLQYRSKRASPDNYLVNGYQADLHPNNNFFGMLYHQGGKRGIVAQRFQKVDIAADGTKEVTAFGNKDIKWNATQWNELRVVAVGNRLIHQINGITTVDVTDNHPEAHSKGIIALQIHAGEPMKVEYKDIVLRKVEGAEAKSLLAQTEKEKEMDKLRTVVKFDLDAEEINFINGKKAQWVWKDNPHDNKPIYLTKSFDLPEQTTMAAIMASCDNGFTLWINGKEIAKSDSWNNPFISKSILKQLKPGKNFVAIEATNAGGIAGLLFKLSMQQHGGELTEIVSDTSWNASTTPADNWKTDPQVSANWNLELKSSGDLGVEPWGSFGMTADAPASKITTLDDFEVEELFAFPAEMGSKVALTVDDQGRFYASDQYTEGGLHRVTVDEESGRLLIEEVPIELEGAQGLAWHDGALYYYGRFKMQKLTDTDGDGILDHSEELPTAVNHSEHGTHAIRLTEDKKGLYLVAGNHTPMPKKEITSRSRVQGWQEDLLLKREWDARGHARGVMAPGGYMARYDFETKKNEIISVGYRNQYGIASNRFGDSFTYDADMEWDMGSPWYRATRINFVASGSDYGWRSGSGKWPEYYEDSLPAIAEVGPGSPTGVISGIGTKFPAKYQDAIFALDWTFGTMYALHWKFDGAGYKAEKEVFCFGEPLPLTDAVVGKDGYLYFTVGGRKAASRFCRIKYNGSESTAPIAQNNDELPEMHKQRRALEVFHGAQDPSAVAKAWPHLSSKDRWLRGAARVAVESQPVDTWADKVFAEKNPQALIASAVALARQGTPEHQEKLLNALLALDMNKLSAEENTGLLRAYALCFIRMGEPKDAMRDKLIAEFSPQLPSKSDSVNTELVRVLIYLKSPTIITQALEMIAAPHEQVVPNWQGSVISRNKNYGGPVTRLLADYPPVQKLGYAFMLRNLREGWTLEQRREHLKFLYDAAKHPGGLSYTKFLANIRDEVLSHCTPEERVALNDITGEDFDPKPKFAINPPKGPGKNWTVADARPYVTKQALKDANIKNGRSLFFASACASCHRFDGLGGDIGPDLSMVRTKFSANYLLESIIEPSKEISDQYGSKIVTLKDGRVFTGVVVPREAVYDIYPMTKTTEELKPTSIVFEDVESIVESPVSQMPPMLMNGMNGEEVRDLIGYLLSSGIPNTED